MRSIQYRGAASLLGVTLLGFSGCAAVDDGVTSSEDELGAHSAASTTYVPWDVRRAEKQAELDNYLERNREDFWWFLYTPVGRIGIPTAFAYHWSYLFPEIWGEPEEKWAPQGFGPDPNNPVNPVPFGLGRTFMDSGVEIVTLSCAGCHTGRVIGPDGEVMHLYGAPSTQFNQLRTSVEDTVNDPRWDLYYAGNAVAARFKSIVNEKRALIEKTLDAYTFNPERVPNAPYLHDRAKPGYLDAIGVGIHVLTKPEITDDDPTNDDWVREAVLPPWPAQVDLMSVWRQSARPVAQWDGSIPSLLHRNLAAEVGVTGDPTLTDFENGVRTTRFTEGLPAPPYPFAVDDARAARGQALFEEYCAGCHFDGSTRLFTPSVTGTDPNRADTVQEEGRLRLIKALRVACKDPALCNETDDQIIRPFPSKSSRGYLALPLEGIWARAPYLHNGSVPTLYHLLVPSSRPAYFARGNIHYDQENVGFEWRDSTVDNRYVYLFDTTEAGASNGGHDSIRFLGLDWSKHPEKLRDLLEYLKTL